MTITKDALRTATHAALVAQTRAEMAITDATTAVEAMAVENPLAAVARSTLEHGILLNYKGEWAIGTAIGT